VVYDRGSTLDGYARQLDFFGIELGVVDGEGGVQYASQFSAERPTVRAGISQEEKRLFFAWKQGSLQEADRELLKKAGIDSGRRLVLQFYPADVENQLAALELAHAKGRPASKIRKTLFGVKIEGNTYSFHVLRQYNL
jgi:hypothetical protein